MAARLRNASPSALNSLFGLPPLYGYSVWLHGLKGVAALYLGLVYAPGVDAPH
jgi:hypothetical protein